VLGRRQLAQHSRRARFGDGEQAVRLLRQCDVREAAANQSPRSRRQQLQYPRHVARRGNLHRRFRERMQLMERAVRHCLDATSLRDVPDNRLGAVAQRFRADLHWHARPVFANDRSLHAQRATRPQLRHPQRDFRQVFLCQHVRNPQPQQLVACVTEKIARGRIHLHVPQVGVRDQNRVGRAVENVPVAALLPVRLAPHRFRFAVQPLLLRRRADRLLLRAP
jgi:hypothetical protein